MGRTRRLEFPRWGGFIDVTSDVVPIIDVHPEAEALFIATGFFGHGFGIAPGAGRLSAELVTGAPPSVDTGPFSLALSPRSRSVSW